MIHRMNAKKQLIAIVLTIGLVFSILIFINKSNDHVECGSVIKKTIDKKGQEVVQKEHICKEKYSF